MPFTAFGARPGAPMRIQNSMIKTLTTLTAAATIAAALVAAPSDANAQFRRWGPAVGLGVLGGVIVGGALANSYGPRARYP